MLRYGIVGYQASFFILTFFQYFSLYCTTTLTSFIMLTRFFSSSSNKDPVQEYLTSDEIMTSVLSSSDLALSNGATNKSHSRGRLVKKKSPPTTPSRPRTATGTASTYTSSRPSTSTSEYVTANSSATSLTTASYTRQPLPLPKLSDFERRSLTGKRQEADNNFPPPLKVTPLVTVLGGSLPPTPPVSNPGSFGGEIATASIPRTSTSSISSRFTEEISPPFLRNESEISARPSSAGSIFGKRKLKDTTPKEKDRSTFFGRDGELGYIGVQKSKEKAPNKRDSSSSFGKGSAPGNINFRPDIPPENAFRGKLHDKPAGHSASKSIGSSAPAILATPPSPEMEAQHPAHLSPPGTVATTTITTTTTHYHLTGQTVQEKRQSFLPPLHLPQLNLTFDGGSSFSSTNGPSPSAPEFPYRSRDESTSSGKDELDAVPSNNSSSWSVLPDVNKSDKRQLEPIKPAPLFSGANSEKRTGPPVSFYNSKRDLYDRVHLKHENTTVGGSKETIQDKQEHTTAERNFQQQTLARSLTKGGLSATGAHSRTRSQDVWVRGSRRVDVEEVFKDIEATKSSGEDRESRGSGFVVVGARDSFASSNRSSKHDELFAEVIRKINTGTEKVKNTQQEPPHHPPNQLNPPVLLSLKRETQVNAELKATEPLTYIEPGFVFPFAHAVTVDEPVALPSASNPIIYRSQSNPLSIAAFDDTFQPMPENPSPKVEIARPKTAPSTGTTLNGYPREPLGLSIGKVTDNGFVGGWKLDNIRRLNYDPATLPASFTTLPRSFDASCGKTENPAIPRVGHSRKFSYRTIEGMALVEDGKLGNGKELTLADMVVEDQADQKQNSDYRSAYIPFRPVTIIEPQKPMGQSRVSEDVRVLADGTTLSVLAPTGNSPAKSKINAESLHREPVIPADKKKGEKEEKRKSKRRWFGWKNKDAVEGINDRDLSGLGPGLSNASMSSKSSAGSSSSQGISQKQMLPSTSSSDTSMTPPSSSTTSNQSSVLYSKGDSAQDKPKGITDLPNTSQRLAPIATTSHPPPSRHHPPPGPQSTPASASSTAVATRSRAKSRESGLRYEVSGVPGVPGAPSPDNPDNGNKLEKNSPVLHHRHQSSSSLNSRNSSAPKPLGKLFVVCCNCEYWHDLPSQMYYEMHERGCSVKCVYCLHGMEVKCCSGYSCTVYVLEKHHGK